MDRTMNNAYDDKFIQMIAYKWLKGYGFCHACGARYPDAIGQSKCEHCIPAFELLEAQNDEENEG